MEGCWEQASQRPFGIQRSFCLFAVPSFLPTWTNCWRVWLFFYHLLLISFYVHFFLFCFFVFLLSRRARFYKAPFFRWQHHQFVPVFRYPICVDAFLRFCCKFWSHGIAYCRLLSPSIHWLHSISYSGGWRILYINLINLTKSPTKSLMVYEATPQSSKSNPLQEHKSNR